MRVIVNVLLLYLRAGQPYKRVFSLYCIRDTHDSYTHDRLKRKNRQASLTHVSILHGSDVGAKTTVGRCQHLFHARFQLI